MSSSTVSNMIDCDLRSQSGAPTRVNLITARQWEYLKNRYLMTDREFQIAKLICRGITNEQIAQRLNIKHATVKTHIRNIYRKTWVHNKVAMLLRFVEDAYRFLPRSAEAHTC